IPHSQPFRSLRTAAIRGIDAATTGPWSLGALGAGTRQHRPGSSRCTGSSPAVLGPRRAGGSYSPFATFGVAGCYLFGAGRRTFWPRQGLDRSFPAISIRRAARAPMTTTRRDLLKAAAAIGAMAVGVAAPVDDVEAAAKAPRVPIPGPPTVRKGDML